MSIQVETTVQFDREFRTFDRCTQRLIKAWINKNLEGCENPRQQGKALKSHLWKYSLGEYRLLCIIQGNKLVLLTLSHGPSAEIYENSFVPNRHSRILTK